MFVIPSMEGCSRGPVPDWAMASNARRPYAMNQHRPYAASPVAQRPDASEMVSSRQTSDEMLKPFSPEWFERERLIDERLRRRLKICGGC
jgi:hypothetical protein